MDDLILHLRNYINLKLSQMKNIQITLYLLFILAIPTYAQTPDQDITNRMNYVFEKIDKNKISTGVLSNYGVQPVEFESFNGIPADSNYVDLTNFMLLYSGVYSAKINSNISLILPDTLTQRLNNITSTTIPLVFMHYAYNRLKENAVELGLVQVVNDQIVEVSGAATPYETLDLFAVAPRDVYYNKSTISFLFSSDFRLTNINKTVQSLQIRFDEESEYQTANWDIPISHSYSTNGIKKIYFRIDYTDGTYYISQTNIVINAPTVETRSSSLDFEHYIPSTSEHSGGTLQIKYANSDHILRKPLIIAEGFDPSKEFGEPNLDIDNLLKPTRYVGSINYIYKNPNIYTYLKDQSYDIVYLDYNNSLDDIRRNAALLKDAIIWVNSNKKGSTPNIVMGISMGGLVARYALRKMEVNNIDHSTWKFISIDSPHKGANIPIGYQAALRHVASLDLKYYFIKILSAPLLYKEIASAVNVLNSQAARQMLIYWTNDGNSIDNSTHDAFQKEYDQLGMPIKCQNIAVSNGCTDGTMLFSPGTNLLSYNETISLKWWMEVLNGVFGSTASLLFGVTNHSELLLNTLPGNSQFKISANVNAINSNSSTVYHGAIKFKKKIFWLVNATVTITESTMSSKQGMLPIDGAQGSTYELSSLSNDLGQFYQYINKPNFCFVPTGSALAFSDWNNYLSTNLPAINFYDLGKTEFEHTYSPSENEEHTSFFNNTQFIINQITDSPLSIKQIQPAFCGNQVVKLNNVNKIPINWSVAGNGFSITASTDSTATILGPADVRSAILTTNSNNLYQLKRRLITNCNLSLTGPEIICDQATYSIPNLPSNFNVDWSMHPHLSIVSQTNNSVTVQRSFYDTDYDGWITGSILNTNINLSKNNIILWRSGIQSSNDLFSGVLQSYGGEIGLITPIPGVTDYTWSSNVSGWYPTMQNAYFTQFEGDEFSGQACVTVSFTIPGGGYGSIYQNYDVVGNSYFSIYPNPATENSTITLDLTSNSSNKTSLLSTANESSSSTYEVQLWNSFGVIKTIRANGSSVQIPLNGLSKGFYYIHLIKNGKRYKKQFIINK